MCVCVKIICAVKEYEREKRHGRIFKNREWDTYPTNLQKCKDSQRHHRKKDADRSVGAGWDGARGSPVARLYALPLWRGLLPHTQTAGRLADMAVKITVRYVVHDLIEIYEQKGWTVVSRFEGSHHSQYSVIMQAPSEQSFLDLKRYEPASHPRQCNEPLQCSTSSSDPSDICG